MIDTPIDIMVFSPYLVHFTPLPSHPPPANIHALAKVIVIMIN